MSTQWRAIALKIFTFFFFCFQCSDIHEESMKTIKILMPIVIVLLLVLCLLYGYTKYKQNTHCPPRDVREMLSTFHLENKDMEVNITQIARNAKLGEGAFGIVYKGELMPPNRITFNCELLNLCQLNLNGMEIEQKTEVAVKMLKEGSIKRKKKEKKE